MSATNTEWDNYWNKDAVLARAVKRATEEMNARPVKVASKAEPLDMSGATLALAIVIVALALKKVM